jgi:TPR repeat protein
MQLPTFKQSIKDAVPPANITVYLLAMWYDANDNWDKAHTIVDSLDDATACWVHAYLHRKEGDLGNADYWYRKAAKKRPEYSLNEEWEAIVKGLV